MSIDVRESRVDDAAPPPEAASVEPADRPIDVASDAPPPVPLLPTALAAALATGAAAVTTGGLFRGWLPFAVGAVAVLAGIVPISLAHRSGRTWPQWTVLPTAALLGAGLVALDSSGKGTANLPSLVVESIRSGGILQPPVSFDPGWRFLLTVLIAVLAAGSLSLALVLRRPRLAVLVPIPLAMAGELIQPPSREVAVSAAAVVLVIGALGLAYGATLRASGVVVTGGFQGRRLLRTAALMLALVVGVVALPQVGFLFPQPNRSHVTPPQRPPSPPPVPDRVLFTYTSPTHTVPLRIGVIDVYDARERAWLLPPYDARRFEPVKHGHIPGTTPSSSDGSFRVAVRIADVPGHVLPGVAGMTQLDVHESVELDPRTDVARLASRRLYAGLRYEMTVPKPVSGKVLAQAPTPPPSLAPFLDAPPVPNEVLTLLKDAPKTSFDRLQTLRQALLTNVVAAGAGKPTDLPVSRVLDMLKGAEANPYEITAAEALLARWAGVPSRIGYGYYGGQPSADGAWEIHPRHGATWLEAYFTGPGWVPIVGFPLKAKSSTSDNQKNDNTLFKPTDDVALSVYVPTREYSTLQYFQVVGYWVRLVLPFVLLGGLVAYAYPAALKSVRRRRRRRWAARRGPAAQVLVAYAEFRDTAADLTFADPLATPLDYLDALDPDEEHQELAWLVTRACWGDLTRSLLPYDAMRAVELARSVSRRLTRGQSKLNVVLAKAARSSLREPYSTEIPNLWWPQRRRAATAAVTALAMVLLVGCGSGAKFVGPLSLRAGLTPAKVGIVELARQDSLAAVYAKAGRRSLVANGEVYTVRHGQYVEGTVQISLLKTDVRADDPRVMAGIDSGFGGASFRRVDLVPDRIVWQKDLVDVRVYLWFPPRANAVELLVLRKRFGQHRELATALLNFQHGRAPQPFDIPEPR